ncbi:hypothetical protein BH09VER1_BH09VER1_18880 [soil metagenome]
MLPANKSSLPIGLAEPANDQGRQLARFRRVFLKADELIARYGAWVIVLFAFIYYAQYFRSGLNLAGEGGTVALQALRLMDGQRPIVDTFLGYNVMWFYPVVWLFSVVGPNYLALRIYFFCICTAGALLGFFTLRRATRSGIYSLLLSGVLVLIPGMLFRNYMPFLGLLNTFVLLEAFVFGPKSNAVRLVWMAAAGATVGLTFLFRVDLGLFYSLILAGSILLFPFGVRGKFWTRSALACSGFLLAVIMVGLTHLPVYLDAKTRGFGESFLGQYTGWTHYMRGALKAQVKAVKSSDATTGLSSATPVAGDGDAPDDSGPTPENDHSGLKRPSWESVRNLDLSERVYFVLTYLPILLSGLFLLGGGIVFLYALARCDESLRESSLAVLTSLGCALALFPQFFFFRPDTPHLSEFMAPFLATLGCAAWSAALLAAKLRSMIARASLILVVLLCLVEVTLYLFHAMPKESAGTIAASRKRHQEFVAQNGVRVLLKNREQQEYQSIYDAVLKYSTPQDYVVCYPYAPTINFMTNRRSYEYNVYVDNATASARFQQDFLDKLARYQPAVILIDNRDINKSDSSRFAVWAASSYEYVRQNYKLVGTYHRQEIYVRPDRFNADKSAS